MLYSFMAPKCLDTTHLNGFLLLIKEAEKGGMLEKYAPIEMFQYYYFINNLFFCRKYIPM